MPNLVLSRVKRLFLSLDIFLYIYSALQEAETMVVKIIYLINKDILIKDQINVNAINAIFYQWSVFVRRLPNFVKKC